MRIKWEELRLGDEFIIGNGGNLRYLKVIQLPDGQRLTSVKCTEKKGYGEFEPDTSKHDKIVHYNDSWRVIWLVKRFDHG